MAGAGTFNRKPQEQTPFATFLDKERLIWRRWHRFVLKVCARSVKNRLNSRGLSQTPAVFGAPTPSSWSHLDTRRGHKNRGNIYLNTGSFSEPDTCECAAVDPPESGGGGWQWGDLASESSHCFSLWQSVFQPNFEVDRHFRSELQKSTCVCECECVRACVCVNKMAPFD